jgi:hypothetical protein
VVLRAPFLLLAMLPYLASCQATTTARGARSPSSPGPGGGIPAAAFFRAPVLSDLCLSPDGSHVAAIATRDGVQVLVVRATGGGQIRFLAKLDERGQSIRTVGWASDEHLLVSVEMPSHTAVGVRARQTRLLVVPRDGSPPSYLGRHWPLQEYSQFQDQIIDWLRDDPDHVLINWWQPDQNGASVRRVDVKTGRLTTVTSSIPFVRSWAADHRGQVRAGWGSRPSGTRYFLYARVSPDDDFEKVIDFDPFE